MVSITEIAPPLAGRTVMVLGTEIEIYGVTNRQWAVLARRFPELKRKIAGLEVAKDDEAVSGMESIPAIIAAGLGKLGDDETEAAVDRLPGEAQVALMSAIMDLSFPPARKPNPTEEAVGTTTPTASETAVSTTSP